MLTLLESNFSLVVGAVLALVLLALRASSQDKTLRGDLRGAILLLVSFLMVRVAWLATHAHLPPAAGRAMNVAWMLLFAFGVIRSAVSLGLWLIRLRTLRATPKILRDVIDFSLYALAAVPILKAELDIDLTGLLATSAIVSVVIGLALQDTLGNLFAGLAIQLERPFQVGDIVNIGEHTGRVVQVAWRATRLETSRRESITLPNSILSRQSVTNYSRLGLVGVDVLIGLAYDIPPNRVKEVMLDLVRDLPIVLAEPPPTCRVLSYDDSRIRYRIRYFVKDYADAGDMRDELYTRLWYRLRREQMEIPFPQHTVHTKVSGEAPAVAPPADLPRLLEAVDLFSVLSERDRARLAKELVPRRFGRGERILDRGTHGHTIYLLAEGEVSVKAGEGAGTVEVTRLGRGQYFGEMSLLTGEPRAATVVAATDVLLLELDRPILARLFAEHPDLARHLSALLAQRRAQLRAAAEATGHDAEAAAPEAGHIFGRLRQIFGLGQS